MQDRYAFDQGDFSKVGLIRLFGRDAEHGIGLVWYANQPTREEATNDDGRHFTYLMRADRLAACDPDLHAAWARSWTEAPRSIAALEARTPWPRGTRLFAEPVPRERGERTRWFERARAAVSGCALVFCDPDNGIARPGTRAEALPSPKHAMLDELDALLAAGQSVVAYQHCDRSAPHAEQARSMQAFCATRWPHLGSVTALRYRRGSARLYLVLAQRSHERWLQQGIEALRAGPWHRDGHFAIDQPQ